MDVRLQQLSSADVGLIERVTVSSDQRAFLSTPDLSAFLADAPTHPTFTPFGIVVDGEVRGLVSMGTIPDDPTDWWVSLLVIDHHHQGRGLGRAAMLEAVRVATEAGGERLGLSVHPGNVTALALYRSLGFQFEPALRGGELIGWLGLASRSTAP